ncbi:hypothetical protein [Candidatus Lokiarchaeum ossiferum]|uniref:hypothetical protein n=1 Tax=Candidatus Lokiarchaeum ossiferum TaxID=2951803 RepID=UPI00352E8EE5
MILSTKIRLPKVENDPVSMSLRKKMRRNLQDRFGKNRISVLNPTKSDIPCNQEKY